MQDEGRDVPDGASPPSKVQGVETQNIASLQGQQTGRAKGIALKEQLMGGRVGKIRGGAQSVTTVSYFKGNDPSKWKSITYEVVDMGEVYDGIDLRLKAYGNNVEKLFCVKPGANPDQIRIALSGIRPQQPPDNNSDRVSNPVRVSLNPLFDIYNNALGSSAVGWVEARNPTHCPESLGFASLYPTYSYDSCSGVLRYATTRVL